MLISLKNPDIMLFTEVIPKAQINTILESQIKIAGYDEYINFNYIDPNLGSSGIRGVAIYVKDHLKSNEVRLQTLYKDQIWVEINLINNKDNIL